ncbi:hypothetical protein [Aurantiacibacter sp. D1-12]|uniref:hypothetical protein n=1 Tax=Aurantiacibacter sp. D1-12 TaxID=2993658 RepID=UPI00237CE8C9|nr:hypothetical protein [Aurantiacibacter sp. D1-12]MDE1466346.1 hypothetical protein [Aurantiacibacter sp. D1-12]
MKKFTPLLLPILALAACGEEPAPEPVETVAPEPVVELAAPDQALFTELLANACPNAEPVNTAICRRAMGSDEALCEYGLGEDEFLRNDATIAVDDTGENWMIVDAEAVCAQ